MLKKEILKILLLEGECKNVYSKLLLDSDKSSFSSLVLDIFIDFDLFITSALLLY